MAKRFLSNINVNDQYTLPSADGTSGQIIQTDGSGNLSFVDFASDEARKIVFTVKNKDSISLSKGTVVHASPSATPPSGNIIEVIRADNDDSSKMPAIGILNETLAVDAEGECVMLGSVSGIATNSFSIGDELYVSDTPGEFTNTKPTGNTNLIQKIAIVIKSHSTNGLIEVFGAGRSNDVPNQIDRNVNFTDNSKLTFGDSTTPDLEIYHDAANSYIKDTGTGSLIIEGTTSTQIKGSSYVILRSLAGENMLIGNANGSVDLYYDNSKKFETTSTGVTITGSGIIENTSSTTNDSVNVLDLKSLSSGTTANGFGVGLGFFTENSTYSSVNEIGRIEVVETDEVSLDDKMIFYVKDNNTLAERLNITGSGATFAGDVTVNGGDIILGGTGRIQGVDTVSANTDAANKLYVDNAVSGLVDGSGATGQVAVWSDTDTITGYTRFKVYDAGGQIQVTDGTRDIRINSGFAGSTAMIGTSSSHDLGFMTGNSQRITIDTSGNVGIGTTSPSSKLHIKQSVDTIDGGLTWESVDGTQEWSIDANNAGNFRIYKGTTAIARFDSSGNFGIGTTSPDRKLHVNSGSTNIVATFESTDATAAISLQDNSTTDDSTVQIRAVGDDFNIVAGGAQRVTVDSSGSVGIGTTSPSYKLQVEGGIKVGSDAGTNLDLANAGIIIKGSASGNNSYMIFEQQGVANWRIGNRATTGNFDILSGGAGNERLTITTAGNVGIGITNPAAPLVISNGGAEGIEFNYSVGNEARIISYNRSNNTYKNLVLDAALLRFKISGSEKLTINSSGNVGIGTTLPNAQLEISNSTATSGTGGATLRLTRNDSTSVAGDPVGTIEFYSTDADTPKTTAYIKSMSEELYGRQGSLAFGVSQSNNTNATEAMRIDNSGNLGIGTSSPDRQLQVHESTSGTSAAKFTNSTTGEDGDTGFLVGINGSEQPILFGYNSTDMVIGTNGAERMRIDSSGKLLVGITSAGTFDMAKIKGTNSVANDFTLIGPNTSQVRINFGDTDASTQGEIGYNNSTDSMRIVTNGSERMRIDSSGNVGIGTTSPNYRLVTYKSNTNYNAFFTGGNGTKGVGVGYDNTSPVIQGLAYNSDTTYYDLSLQPSGGNVGIGTSSPTQGKVDILDAGDYDAHTGHGLTINSNANNAFTSMYMGADDSVDAAYIQSAGRNTSFTSKKLLLNPNGGNVGIGTDDPDYNLEVYGTDAKAFVHYGNNSRGGIAAFSTQRVALTTTSSSDDLVFGYNSATDATSANFVEHMRIDNGTGNVGIGTTSPNALLQVNNTSLGEFAGGNSSNAGGSHLILMAEGDSSRTLMSGPSIVFKTPANSDGTNIWATSRILGSPAAAGSARGTISLQVRDNYDPLSDGTSWNWRTALTAINNGNVGIGTNSPSSQLNVHKNAASAAVIELSNTVAPGDDGVIIAQIKANTAGEELTRIETQNSSNSHDNGNLLFYNRNGYTNTFAESMRITGEGNVGIGTDSPDSKLDVTGGDITVNTTGAGFMNFKYSGSQMGTIGTDGIDLKITANADLQILPTGNVGIGTTSPAYKLDVSGDSTSGVVAIRNAANGRDTLRSENAAGTRTFNVGNDGSGHGVLIVRNSSGTITNYIAGSGNSYFNGGNVGIGETSPNAKLEIYGTANSSPQTTNDGILKINSTSTNAIIFGALNSSPFGTYIQSGGSSTYPLLLNPNGGGVGIGETSPWTKLGVEFSNATTTQSSIEGIILANSNTTANNGSAIVFAHNAASGGSHAKIGAIYEDRTSSSEDTSLFFGTLGGGSYGERMRIDGSGDVGIGTVPETAGPTWRTLFVGASLAFISRQSAAGYDSMLANNYYINSSNVDKKRVTGTSSRIFLDGDVFRFQNAGSANANTTITWSEPMRIAANGNVGIGYTSPQFKLHVVGASATEATVAKFAKGSYADTGGHTTIIGLGAENTATWTKAALAFERTGSYDRGKIHFLQENTSSTDTTTLADSVMTIQPDGNVGIGTTTFASTSNLQLKLGNMGNGVVGEIFDAVDNADNSRIIICGGGTGTPQFSMRHYSAAYGIDMWLNTSSPWDTYIDNRNAASGFIFRNNCTNDGGEDELMRITGSGNVGIGTDSPSQKLDVDSGHIAVDAGYGLVWSGDVNRIITPEDNSVGGLFKVATGAATRFMRASSESMRIDGLGNVGIGTTSPDAKLDVAYPNSGTDETRKEIQRWRHEGQNTMSLFAYGGAADTIQLAAWNNEQNISIVTETLGSITKDTTKGIYIKSGGSVGIGTTSPSQKLDVDGNIRLRTGVLSSNNGTISHSTNNLLYVFGGSSGLYLSDNTGQQNSILIHDTNYIDFNTAATRRLRIDSSGRMLVGLSGSGNIYVGGSTTGQYFRIHHNNSDTYLDGNGGKIYFRGDSGANTRFEMDMTGTDAGKFTASGDIVAFGSPSDKTLKENIRPIENALDKVNKLEGVEFNWKEQGITNLNEDIGFIAQDVQEVLPQLVRENENGKLSLRHQGIVPVLVEAIKELKQEIETLKSQINK